MVLVSSTSAGVTSKLVSVLPYPRSFGVTVVFIFALVHSYVVMTAKVGAHPTVVSVLAPVAAFSRCELSIASGVMITASGGRCVSW